MKFQKGHIMSEETKEKLRIINTGRRLSESAKERLRVFNKGKKLSKEHKKKIGSANLGHVMSDEQKLLLSKSHIGKLTGINHPNWNGGSTLEPYSVDWTKTLKQSIRERDKYCCQVCGEKQGDKALDVHHIDYDKNNSNINNLISLCPSCHSKTNWHREKWINYFNNK